MFYIIVYAIGVAIDASLSMFVAAPLISLILFAPSIAVTARRLHDINKSGWWQLLVLIPLIGPIILLIWYVSKGNATVNRFGPPVV